MTGPTPGAAPDRAPDFTRSVTVAAPPAVVWTVLRDVVAWPRWTASVTSVEPLTGPELVPGARFRLRQPRLPVAVWTVRDVAEDRGFVWESVAPGVRTRADHWLTPQPDGCEVTLELWQDGPVGALIRRLAAGLTRRYLDLEAEGLRRAAEAAAGSSD